MQGGLIKVMRIKTGRKLLQPLWGGHRKIRGSRGRSGGAEANQGKQRQVRGSRGRSGSPGQGGQSAPWFWSKRSDSQEGSVPILGCGRKE